MKPQDIVVLLKIILYKGSAWQSKELAAKLHISPSEVSKSLQRSEYAGLINAERGVARQALMEFIQYGLSYVFPAKPGSMVNGVLTAHSHPYMAKYFSSSMKYVWADAKGYDRGLEIEPLYENAVKAVKEDEQLYKILALIDVIRVGRVREMKLAIDELKKEIL
ncbi:MAG TPA: hypothetical protein VK167_05435 [Flavipsychrobacter sp.]|nr:hypothetical protein [Flavipsychrobacter sp.]